MEEKKQKMESIKLNESKVIKQDIERYIEKIKPEQNFRLAILVGSGVAIIGAILWAVITVVTEYQIGFMALGIGAGVGLVIRHLGKGVDQTFGVAGAVLSVVGCVLGNFLSVVGFVANSEGIGVFEVLPMIDFIAFPSIMVETFQPMDLLFYGIAIYEGYNLSFRKISPEEVAENLNE